MSIEETKLKPSIWSRITQFKFITNNHDHSANNHIIQTKTYNFFSIYTMTIKQVGSNITKEQNINLVPIIVSIMLYYGIKYVMSKKYYL